MTTAFYYLLLFRTLYYNIHRYFMIEFLWWIDEFDWFMNISYIVTLNCFILSYNKNCYTFHFTWIQHLIIIGKTFILLKAMVSISFLLCHQYIFFHYLVLSVTAVFTYYRALKRIGNADRKYKVNSSRQKFIATQLFLIGRIEIYHDDNFYSQLYWHKTLFRHTS